MRELTEVERLSVSGGLIPIGGGGGGGGTGGGTGGGGTTTNNVLSNPTIQSDVNNSPIMSAEVNALLQSGGSIVYYNNPNAAGGASSTNGNQVDIATSYENKIPETLGQLAHELGHEYYGSLTDMAPGDYSTSDAYASSMEQAEGYAQLFAIRVAQQLDNAHIPVTLPGDPTHVAQEVQVLKDNPNASDAVLAQKIGAIMSTEKLSDGETYDQYYHNGWTTRNFAPLTINVDSYIDDPNVGQWVAVTGPSDEVYGTVSVGNYVYD